MNTLMIHACIGVSFLLLRILFNKTDTASQAKITILVIITQLFAVLVFSILQHTGVDQRVYSGTLATAFFVNPGPYAIYLAALTSSGVIFSLFFFRTKKLILAIGVLALTICGFFYIINSASRSAWIGSAGSLFAIAYLWFSSRGTQFGFLRKDCKKTAIFILICAIFLSFAFLSYYLFNLKPVSANGRFLSWLVTANIIRSNWFVGVGIGRFPKFFLQSQGELFAAEPSLADRFKYVAGDNRFAFNDTLQCIAESGILGSIFFFSALVSTLFLVIKIFKRSPKLSPYEFVVVGVFLATFVVFILSGLTSYPSSVTQINILVWPFFTGFLSKMNVWRAGCLRIEGYIKFVFIMFFFVIGTAVLAYSIKRFYVYKTWSNSIGEQNRLISDIMSDDPSYLLEMSNHFIRRGKYHLAIKHLTTAKEYSSTVELYYRLGTCYEMIGDFKSAASQYSFVEKAIPGLIRPKYLLAVLYYKQGDYRRFKTKSLETIKFNPKVNNDDVMQMKAELIRLRSTTLN